MRRRSLVGALLIAGVSASGCGGSGKPRPSPPTAANLGSELVGRLTASTSTRAFRVEGWAAEGCDPDTSAGRDRIGCHRVLSGGPVLVGAWKSEFVSLLVEGVSYESVRLSPDPIFAVALRFESAGGPTDVLLSLRHRRVVILSRGLPRRSGTIVDRYSDFLRALDVALPRDPEIQDLLAQDRQEADARASGGTYESIPSHAVGCDSALVDPIDPPVSVREVEPEYPALAKEDRIQGTVLLRLLVGNDGQVKDVQLVQGVSSPSRGANLSDSNVLNDIRTLNDAAMAAARQWVFAPATRYGRAVCAWVQVPIVFHL